MKFSSLRLLRRPSCLGPWLLALPFLLIIALHYLTSHHGYADVIEADTRLAEVEVRSGYPICDCNEVKHLLIVYSPPENFKEREEFRKAYTSPQMQKKYSYCAYFITGSTELSDEDTQLKEESEEHGDLIIGKFEDTDVNLNMKGLFWLRYVKDYCTSTKLIVKMDDDVAFNVKGLVHRLARLPAYSSSIYGHVWSFTAVERKSGEKTYVPRSVYPFETYPNYTSGVAYVATRDAVASIISLVDEKKMLKTYNQIDDVVITGILAERAGVQRINMPKWIGFCSDSRESLRQGDVLFSRLVDIDDRSKIREYTDNLPKSLFQDSIEQTRWKLNTPPDCLTESTD